MPDSFTFNLHCSEMSLLFSAFVMRVFAIQEKFQNVDESRSFSPLYLLPINSMETKITILPSSRLSYVNRKKKKLRIHFSISIGWSRFSVKLKMKNVHTFSNRFNYNALSARSFITYELSCSWYNSRMTPQLTYTSMYESYFVSISKRGTREKAN